MVIINRDRSQAYQDEFALRACGDNYTYVEIGGAHPDQNSNTFQLEVNNFWRGFSVELNEANYRQMWETDLYRKNKIYWANAIDFDYVAAAKENDLPMHMGYLSLDIDPAPQTFAATKRVLEQGLTFNCITFEHDLYCSTEDYNVIGTKYLTDLGYKIAVTDVYDDHPHVHIETWFVAPHIDFPRMTFDEFKASIAK